MKFQFEELNNPPADWDKHLLSIASPEILQTSLYGEFCRSTDTHPQYITIHEDESLIGQCLIFLSSSRIVTWSHGPVLATSHLARYNEIVAALLDFLKTTGVVAVENAKFQKFFDHPELFIEDAHLFPVIGESFFVDIRPDFESIIKSFDRSVRKNMNKCESNHVEVIISEGPDLIEPYINLLKKFRDSRNFGMPPLYPNPETMKKFNTPFSSMGIAMAKYQGEYLAGMGYVTFGKVMTELAMATAPGFETAKMPVNDLLKIKAIEYYKQKGITCYDLTGGQRAPGDPKKQGINVFKKKFASGAALYGMIDRRVFSLKWYPYALNKKVRYIFQKITASQA